MKPDIRLGYYKHYSGKVYQVFYVARDVGNLNNWLVVYGDGFRDWVRSARFFHNEIISDLSYIGEALTFEALEALEAKERDE
ncbi:MAG: DUF1653 domain-containing protein [Chroococcidiopsis sp.]